MDVAKIIKQGVGVVAAILSAFGGFLLHIAPPQEAQAGFAVGVTEFILLIVFLVIRFLREYHWTREKTLKVWSLVAIGSGVIFLCAAPLYYWTFQNSVYTHVDGSLFVKGDKLTEYAEIVRSSIYDREGVITDIRLMQAIGDPHKEGVVEKVWTPESINSAKSRLVLFYVASVFSIGCTILALTALWGADPANPQPRPLKSTVPAPPEPAPREPAVDDAGPPQPAAKATDATADSTVRVFVSYSHDDAQYLDRVGLLKYLSGLKHEGFEFWYDEYLMGGDLWDKRIKEEMARADIALVLVSQSFLDSDYCRNVEVANFIKLRAEKGLTIYPVILSHCSWKEHEWLVSTQFQPRNDKSLKRNYTDRGVLDELFLKIREELKALGEKVRAKRANQ